MVRDAMLLFLLFNICRICVSTIGILLPVHNAQFSRASNRIGSDSISQWQKNCLNRIHKLQSQLNHFCTPMRCMVFYANKYVVSIEKLHASRALLVFLPFSFLLSLYHPFTFRLHIHFMRPLYAQLSK